MARGISLLGASLDFEYSYSEICMNEQVFDNIGLNELDSLDFFILYYLFVNNWFLIVDIHNSNITPLIRYVKLLMLSVPID